MKKLIAISAITFLLLAAVTLVRATFSNTYSNSSAASYDGTTLYWTEMINGTTTTPPGTMVTTHTPRDMVCLTGNVEQGACLTDPTPDVGQGVSSKSSMAYSHTWAFDFEAVCSIEDLDTGACFGETNPRIWCPVSNGFFFFLLKKIQFETAYTFTKTTDDAGDNFWVQSTNCSNTPSQPIDWPGEGTIHDPNGMMNMAYIQSAVLYRVTLWGTSFDGIAWQALPGFSSWTEMAPGHMDPGPCTSHDGNPPIGSP